MATSDTCLGKYSIIRFVKISFIGKFKSYELRRKPQLDVHDYSVFFQDSESNKSVQVFFPFRRCWFDTLYYYSLFL